MSNMMTVSIVLLTIIPTVSFTIGMSHYAIRRSPLFMSTYSVDQSDYSPKESDFENDNDWTTASLLDRPIIADKFQSKELSPVPMSKNAGNRFVVFLWDRILDSKSRDPIMLHEERIQYTEGHVMSCRKANLYNETFNAESMVDVLWSRQILSSDVQRVIGQALCLESSELGFALDFLQNDPLVQFFTGGDLSNIPIYRWRHIRDYTLRRDDGRHGTPALLLALDDDSHSESREIRQEDDEKSLEYLIRSERVIAAGPLHVCTESKDDPSSIPIGDLILFNAQDRDEAIAFAENDPKAQSGLYKSMQVHLYNNLDVTGKFVAKNRFDYEPTADLKQAMERWGYPVSDEETPWLNW
jgi:uncharacterized protein YciI